MSSTQATMEKLLSRLRTAPESDFYRALWGENVRFSELPTVEIIRGDKRAREVVRQEQ